MVKSRVVSTEDLKMGAMRVCYLQKIGRHSDVFMVQYVAQYPDGTSFRTLETRTQFLRDPFQLSANKVFRMKAEHFSFNMKVLAI